MLNMTSHKTSGNHEFLLDSGASSHMSPQHDWLHNMHTIQTREIRLGNDATVSAEAAGDCWKLVCGSLSPFTDLRSLPTRQVRLYTFQFHEVSSAELAAAAPRRRRRRVTT
jgi:hypothetical protein